MNQNLEEALCRTAAILADTFGHNCETVVHDFSDSECRLVAIYNNHVSGRSPDSTETIYGMTISPLDIKELAPDRDYDSIIVYTRDGRKIKTSSINFIGPGYHYVLGINVDLTPVQATADLLSGLLRGEGDFSETDLATKKTEELFERYVSGMGKPVEDMNRSERRQLISILEESGFFSIQKAVPYVAERLGVTRYTVYNYLKQIRSE